MRTADGPQNLDQHKQRKNGGEVLAISATHIATAQTLSHDARTDHGAEQGGGAYEFSEKLLFRDQFLRASLMFSAALMIWQVHGRWFAASIWSRWRRAG